jgi:hypothetical protein
MLAPQPDLPFTNELLKTIKVRAQKDEPSTFKYLLSLINGDLND